MTGVEYIDSTGIGMVALAAGRLERIGRQTRRSTVSAAVEHV
jgi:anti-anti-sigma regulatory factor